MSRIGHAQEYPERFSESRFSREKRASEQALILWIKQSRVVDPTSLCVEGCPSRSKLRIVFSYGLGLLILLQRHGAAEVRSQRSWELANHVEVRASTPELRVDLGELQTFVGLMGFADSTEFSRF